jgi:type I restriction enzyme S subunit
MKESGIDWFKQIPENWEVKRLKYLCKFKTGGTPEDRFGINYEAQGYPWITAPDLSDTFNIDTYTQYISNEAINKCKYKLFPPKTILLVCIASVGKLGMLRDYAYANQQITALMVNDIIQSEFLLYYMSAISTKIISDASNNVVPIVNSTYLSNISCVLPPHEEQIEIASFLNSKCARIHAVIEEKKNSIDAIKQYKKSLIYEYVTGKKRVKEVM